MDGFFHALLSIPDPNPFKEVKSDKGVFPSDASFSRYYAKPVWSGGITIFYILINFTYIAKPSRWGGTGAGITAAGEGRSDIAICIIVSKDIYDAGVKEITKDQLKNIYDGNITNWEDLNGPDAEIFAIAREDGSGTRDTFNELIIGSTTVETPGVKTVRMSSVEIKKAVTESNNAIGYVGFSYAEGGDIVVWKWIRTDLSEFRIFLFSYCDLSFNIYSI